MPEFLPGVDLARRYYTEAVRPLLGDRPHAAARLGPGSDVLGFDTARSTDHDWGPRVEVFTDDPAGLDEILRERLPKRFLGWSTHFVRQSDGVRSMADTDGPVDHFVTITGFPEWCRTLLGFDPGDEVRLLDWLATPWQRFAEITAGAVFHDPDGTLGRARAGLRWYPADVWRYVLACQWRRIAQEEAFPVRAAEAGDEAGSLLETARLARETARLLLLLERRWPPYGKWLMRALRADPALTHLLAALEAPQARVREDALCTAFEIAGARQNGLGLSAAVPATRRTFHGRGYAVIDADRFGDALIDRIADPALAAMARTGSADQFLDSTDVLTDAQLTRRIMSAVLRP